MPGLGAGRAIVLKSCWPQQAFRRGASLRRADAWANCIHYHRVGGKQMRLEHAADRHPGPALSGPYPTRRPSDGIGSGGPAVGGREQAKQADTSNSVLPVPAASIGRGTDPPRQPRSTQAGRVDRPSTTSRPAAARPTHRRGLNGQQQGRRRSFPPIISTNQPGQVRQPDGRRTVRSRPNAQILRGRPGLSASARAVTRLPPTPRPRLLVVVRRSPI